jgi:1-phosphofructokinase
VAGETTADAPRAAIFGPSPLLSVTIERRGAERDDIHLHAAGQGVWVARMAGELGAWPVLCGFAGGETGATLRSLLERLPGEVRLVETAGGSGCYVTDRRDGERRLLASALAPPPSRHEVDDLFSIVCAAALESDVLVVCNPFPGDVLPLELYGNLVSDVRDNGTPVLVDLSSPRLDSALAGGPDLVKLNDWELAQYVSGSVSAPEQMHAAAQRLRDAGAGIVVVTRGGEPAFVLCEEGSFELTPPRFDRGAREGCGDSMMGGLAAAWARGAGWREALTTGAAAGAANFLRHGLGTGSRQVVEELTGQVRLRSAGSLSAGGTEARAARRG